MKAPREIIAHALFVTEGEGMLEQHEVAAAEGWLMQRDATILRLRAALRDVRDLALSDIYSGDPQSADRIHEIVNVALYAAPAKAPRTTGQSPGASRRPS